MSFSSSLDINTKVLLPACILENSDSQKLLGVTIDRKLTFKNILTTYVIRQAKKIKHSQEFSHIYHKRTQKRILMNGYFMTQFGSCPLVQMNHSTLQNSHISGLHKRTLSLVYNDFSSSFSELFEKGKSVTIHHRNLQTLACEIFKVKITWRLKY